MSQLHWSGMPPSDPPKKRPKQQNFACGRPPCCHWCLDLLVITFKRGKTVLIFWKVGFLCFDRHHTDAETEAQPDKALSLQVFNSSILWILFIQQCFKMLYIVFNDFSMIYQWYILWCSDTSPTHLHLLSLPASSLCSGASNITRWQDIGNLGFRKHGFKSCERK